MHLREKIIIIIHFILLKEKDLLKEFHLKSPFVFKLLNRPASYCLINFDFLQSHTAHFDKSIILLLFVFTIFGVLLSVSFLHFNQHDSNFL